MTTVLSIEHLQTKFKTPDGLVTAVKDVSLTLKTGETLALVGESGSGKSVTAHSILRLLAAGKSCHPHGRIMFNNKDLLRLNGAELRAIRGQDICMIFQEPMTALNPLHHIGKQIAECLDHKSFPTAQARKERCIELLNQVQIPAAATRLKSYPHELSGGQRQRVMIAMAIANNPKVLIADEPTTALDVTVQNEILHLLKHLQQQNNMAILLISHDLPMVKHFADTIAVMKDGKIVESNDCKAIFSDPQDVYTQTLLAQSPSLILPLNKHAKTLLTVNNLQVQFPAAKTQLKHLIHAPQTSILKGLTFSLKQGETLAVVGESGSGKSTLARALMKLTACQGEIHFQGQDIVKLSEKAFKPLRKHIQIVFQDPFASLNPRMTVLQLIEEGLLSNKNLTAEQRLAAVEKVMHQVGLSQDCLNRFAHEFSGGQRQRIAIARAVVMEPDCLILDEPTSALDRSIQFQVLELLHELQQTLNLSYIFISHDLSLVKSFCHSVLVLKEGQQVEYSDSETLFSKAKNSYTRQLIESALT